MLPETRLLKPAAAAVVAGVEVNNVNKLIDEHILPKELFVQNDGRRVLPGGCVAISFYFHSAGILDAHERRRTVNVLAPRLRNLWWSSLARYLEQDWIVKSGFVSIDLSTVLIDTWKRLDSLTAAHETVISDSHILGGTPVIKGTRVPVYAVAAMVAEGIRPEQIREDYPSIDDEQIKLAAIYAKANPPRGRPPSRIKLPPDAKLKARHGFPRRKAG